LTQDNGVNLFVFIASKRQASGIDEDDVEEE